MRHDQTSIGVTQPLLNQAVVVLLNGQVVINGLIEDKSAVALQGLCQGVDLRKLRRRSPEANRFHVCSGHNTRNYTGACGVMLNDNSDDSRRVPLKVPVQVTETINFNKALTSGCGVDRVVFEDPGVRMVDVDSVQAGGERGIDVGAGTVADHPRGLA